MTTEHHEMTGRERVACAIARQGPDRVPVVALMIHHAIRLAGLRYDQCARDPALLVQAHLAAWKAYGYDGFHVTCDNWVLPSALGCPIQFFPDQPPTAAARILADTKDLARLAKVHTGTEGRLGFKVEATRLAAQAVGDRCHLKTCFDSGPFSLATALRGIEQLMLDCLDDPPFVLESEDCQRLLREGVQYYHRYISFWQKLLFEKFFFISSKIMHRRNSSY